MFFINTSCFFKDTTGQTFSLALFNIEPKLTDMSLNENDFKAPTPSQEAADKKKSVPVTGKIILIIQFLFMIGLVVMYARYDIFKKMFN